MQTAVLVIDRYIYSSFYVPFSSSTTSFSKSMAQIQSMEVMKGRKRPRSEDNLHDSFRMPLDELNQDLLEKILSWLPASSFFRLRSVCRRWKSMPSSPTFYMSCSQISFREPWFLMVDPDLNQSIVFDTSEGNWKNIGSSHPTFLPGTPDDLKPIPVASSGGLVCFLTTTGSFAICNPVTGARRQLPPAAAAAAADDGNGRRRIHAIAMKSSPYKLVVVSGDFPSLSVRAYESGKERWEEEAALSWKPPTGAVESDMAADHETVYFLSKAGDVVATNMQRSPSKQYSSVLTVEGGEEHMYFLSPTGAVVACNLARRSFLEYPRLLPVDLEHSIDVVECLGEMMVVILSEFLESASLRVWRFCKPDQQWHQVAAMPPSMAHEFYGKKADVNCVGFRDMIFMCVSSAEFSRYVTYSLVSGQWCELPKCYVNGTARGFMSAFAFEPRVEARV